MRAWLIEKRKEKKLTRCQMARLCNCTRTLISMLEVDDAITHPGIAARVAYHYGLTLDEFNALVPEKRRKNKLPPMKKKPSIMDYYAVKYASRCRYKNIEGGENIEHQELGRD